MKKIWMKGFGAFALAAVLTTGCTAEQTTLHTDERGKLQIVTTIYPMYEFTRQVAGEHAEVLELIPPGVEPHDWEPTAKEMMKLQQAHVFVYNGAGLEGWVDTALTGVQNDKLVVVETTKGLDLQQATHEHEHEEEHGANEEHDHDAHEDHADEHEEHEQLDPHVWLDPVLAQQQVRAIQTALSDSDPLHQDEYKRNADAYIAKLQDLDRAYQAAVDKAQRKEFVTQHAAFGYLAKRYGLQQIPISGISPHQEPSPAQMADVVRFAKEHDVKWIYFETLVAPKVAEAVALEVGAETSVLNPLEGLTAEERTGGQDYISLMKKNLQELQKTLGGN